MPKRYVITLTASNRIGIMAAVANAMAELGGQLEEIKQTLLQGFFTMIMAAEFPEHRERQVIIDHLHGVCGPFGIELTLHDPEAAQASRGREPAGADPEATASGSPGVATFGSLEEAKRRLFLTLGGTDKPGVLSRIATRLACEGIDITEMYATRIEGAKSFEMVMELALPQEVGVRQLHASLEELGRDIGLTARLEDELSFRAAGDPSLRWRH